MKTKHIIIAAWLILILSALPEVIGLVRFRWADQTPVSDWFARVIQHRAACIPFTQWFIMVTLFLGWQAWRKSRSETGRTILLAAGLPLLLSLFVNLYEIHTWHFVTRYNLRPQEQIDPATFLKPLGEDPNHEIHRTQ